MPELVWSNPRPLADNPTRRLECFRNFIFHASRGHQYEVGQGLQLVITLAGLKQASMPQLNRMLATTTYYLPEVAGPYLTVIAEGPIMAAMDCSDRLEVGRIGLKCVELLEMDRRADLAVPLCDALIQTGSQWHRLHLGQIRNRLVSSPQRRLA